MSKQILKVQRVTEGGLILMNNKETGAYAIKKYKRGDNKKELTEKEAAKLKPEEITSVRVVADDTITVQIQLAPDSKSVYNVGDELSVTITK